MQNSNRVLIGLCNPKSPSNVGAVLRAAGCYQAHGVRYTGTRFDRAAKYNTDTKNMNSAMPLQRVEQILDQLPEGMAVVCVELVEGATPLPAFQHPEQALYVFGPEDGSIPQPVIDRASAVVFVPTVGCMNLAASVNVLLYDRLAKLSPVIDNDAQIRSSRDRNNRLRVRA
jgi:tRNA(Leu) C34 or U34 (ribose-2'-O)-methylase TrmL